MLVIRLKFARAAIESENVPPTRRKCEESKMYRVLKEECENRRQQLDGRKQLDRDFDESEENDAEAASTPEGLQKAPQIDGQPGIDRT